MESKIKKKTYTNKYQKYIVCSYGYKLVCPDDTFSKLFKKYLGEDAVYNFINSVIEESEYCSKMMKKHFSKELLMAKEDNENFKNFAKCWICDNDYVDNDFKLIDHCHIARKYILSPHRYCNMNFTLTHKISVVFHNLKNYSHLNM